MTDLEEVERNLKFLEDLRKFLQKRVRDEEMAHGAVCSLVLEATQLAHVLTGDVATTRDLMVGALNLGLKHGLK